MILKLDAAIKAESWYPSNRPFTEAEARIDLLLSKGTIDITLDSAIVDLAKRWTWQTTVVQLFLSRLTQEKFLERDWYLSKKEETLENRTKAAHQVIDLFNSVFNRSIQLNDYRKQMICKRIDEGKTLKPPIGIDQFRAVFEHKKKEWQNTDQEQYLQIETLCAKKHFLAYLDQARAAFKKKQQSAAQPEGQRVSGVMFK